MHLHKNQDRIWRCLNFCTVGASRAWWGHICLLREDEGGNAWAQEVDAYASTKLESTNTCNDRDLLLRTLPCLNLPWLSAMMPIIKLYKDYRDEIQWNEAKQRRQKKFGNASSDYRNQSVEKNRRCIFELFYSSEEQKWKKCL